MSTKYTDSSPVVVSPQPRRSSCSCVAAGCGCAIVGLLVIVIAGWLLWPQIQRGIAALMADATKQMARVFQEEASKRIESDPRVIERLGEPVSVTLDESQPFTIQDPRVHLNVEGPKGKATATAIWGDQDFASLEVRFEDGTVIDVMDAPPVDVEQAADEQDEQDDRLPPPLDAAYRESLQRAREDQRVIDRIGAGTRGEWVSGSIEPSRAEWEVILHGETGTATLNATAETDGSEWNVTTVQVTFEDDEQIQIEAVQVEAAREQTDDDSGDAPEPEQENTAP